MDQFGTILSTLRRSHNLSQAELGKIIYVSGATISNYENNTHLPDVPKLVSLANYFNVSTDYLLGLSTSALTIDFYEKQFLDGVSAIDILRDLCSLSKERQTALSVILHDMNFTIREIWKPSLV